MSSYRAYEYLGELGKGSYGSVTKNRHNLTGDIVAIKCFGTENKNFATVRKSVVNESTALRELRSDNVVRLFHVFMDQSAFYMVFELLEKTLLDVIREAPKKMLGCGPRTRSLTFQLLRALAFIHARFYVHRDVKPENILLSSNGVLKLADLGFAIKLTQPGQRYSTYTATRWYRAPELLTGDCFYGRGVDIWAAGAVIFEMILGQPLAAGANDAEQLAKTIDLVGSFPKYMLDRLKTCKSIICSKTSFEGLERLLQGQSDLFQSLIKSCLEVEPRQRPSADTLLLHPLFNHDNKHYAADITSTIRQSLLENSHNAALRYQAFLRKRELYQSVCQDLLLNPHGFLTQAAMSRYRQMGLDEHVIRNLTEVINRDDRMPVDFVGQNAQLFQTGPSRGQGDCRRGRNNERIKPELQMYFQAPSSKPAKPDPQRAPQTGVSWRQSDLPTAATTTPCSPAAYWQNFRFKNPLPGAVSQQTAQRTIKLQPATTTKRYSLIELPVLSSSNLETKKA